MVTFPKTGPMLLSIILLTQTFLKIIKIHFSDFQVKLGNNKSFLSNTRKQIVYIF